MRDQSLLSTPHGALGTEISEILLEEFVSLSTPHGALGTLKLEKRNSPYLQLSTPHGALGTLRETSQSLRHKDGFQLHTVH